MGGTGRALIVYTGGTIGMLPSDPGNLSSPLVPATWEELSAYVPGMTDLNAGADLHEMDLVDSSDMAPDYWVRIARVIEEKYPDYDGFVILHGTDTMTYTASALSFLLENLDKPVILTGSQLPAAMPRSDAIQNLVTSLMIASPGHFCMSLPVVPEVCIFFHNLLLRGNRSRKISSTAYRGFDSPNCAALGRAGEHIDIDREIVRKPSGRGFFINDTLEKNVLMFDIFPGLDPGILRKLFDIGGLRGLVLRTYGAGNAPTDKAFLKAIEYAVDKKGIAVVNVSQCQEGMVQMGHYDAGANLLRLGVISGADMTPEAALVKLQFLLGSGYDADTVRELMQRNLRGEQSADLHSFVYGSGAANPVFTTPSKSFPSDFQTDGIESVTVRIDGAASDDPAGDIELALFYNYPNAAATIDSDATACAAIPQCLGIAKKTGAGGGPANLVMDCTGRFQRVVTPKRPVQLRIVSRTNRTVTWKSVSVSISAQTK